jgi:hypothetical protein
VFIRGATLSVLIRGPTFSVLIRVRPWPDAFRVIPCSSVADMFRVGPCSSVARHSSRPFMVLSVLLGGRGGSDRGLESCDDIRRKINGAQLTVFFCRADGGHRSGPDECAAGVDGETVPDGPARQFGD